MTMTVPLLTTKGYEALWNISNSNHQEFYEDPSAGHLKELMVQHATSKGQTPDELWNGDISLQYDIELLNDGEVQSNDTDAVNAPAIRAALPELTPARAADHRLWASLNCFALLTYSAKRWAASANSPAHTSEAKKLREWVQQHYLGHGTQMKRYNAAARLWWLTKMAQRVAPYSKHDADRLLVAMANDVEMYHQLLDRPYLASNPRIVASIYDLALAGNDYLLKRPYPNRMLQALNIKAAAVSLGALSDNSLRSLVEAAKPPKEH